MTTRWPCAVVMLSLMACSRAPLVEGGCAGVICSEAQRCEPSILRCVKNELPKVMLMAPTTVVSDARFEVSGTVTDDTEGTTLEWRDGVDEWQPVKVDDAGAFVITVPSRALDAEPMLLTVRANDGLLQVERSIIVIVDRVAPKVELKTPAFTLSIDDVGVDPAGAGGGTPLEVPSLPVRVQVEAIVDNVDGGVPPGTTIPEKV